MMGNISTYRSEKLLRIMQDINIVGVNNLTLYDNTSYDDDGLGYFMVFSKHRDTVIHVDARTFKLKNNHCIVLNLNAVKYINKQKGNALYVLFNGRLADRYIEKEMIDKILEFNFNDKIIDRMRQLEMNIKMGSNMDSLSMLEMGFGLVLDILMYKANKNSIPRLVLDTIETINAEYNYLYGIDDLAERIGVNKSYLIRVFKAAMNTTPGKYLEDLRIEKAKALLSKSEFSIEVVANLCGYSNANYFGKVFKKKVGISPTEYAKKNATNEDVIIANDIYV